MVHACKALARFPKATMESYYINFVVSFKYGAYLYSSLLLLPNLHLIVFSAVDVGYILWLLH